MLRRVLNGLVEREHLRRRRLVGGLGVARVRGPHAADDEQTHARANHPGDPCALNTVDRKQSTKCVMLVRELRMSIRSKVQLRRLDVEPEPPRDARIDGGRAGTADARTSPYSSSSEARS